MEIEINWTRTAEVQLEHIFIYHKSQASEKIARNLVEKIVQRTIQLKTQPNSGPKEPLLDGRKNIFRYLIEGNYKIIYWQLEGVINIAAVFDCRQNPELIRNL